MPQQIGIELRPEIAERLQQIPSAVTPGERRLALHYTAAYWDGCGDVFENGPLLGGATRPLAMGMLLNEKRDEDSLLHTFDWWNSHEPLDIRPEDVMQTISDLTDPRKEVERIDRAFWKDGTFLPLFEAIHRNDDYWPLIRTYPGYLPGHRDEVPPEGPETIFKAPEREFSLAFVDGCKSWYGTKYWFKEMASRWLPNTDLMFQDFGHYTCFWIPMLIWTFREHFDLIAYVDFTYVWRLKIAPTEQEIDERFPDEPDGFTRRDYDLAFSGLWKEANERGDSHERLLTQMQTAAAYSYIGLVDEARKGLDDLLMQSEWFGYRSYLKQARISPAYTPEGRIEL